MSWLIAKGQGIYHVHIIKGEDQGVAKGLWYSMRRDEGMIKG